MNTKWEEGNSDNILTGKSILELMLLWGHQAPKNPPVSREKMCCDRCTMTPVTLLCWKKFTEFQGKILSIQTYKLHFNESGNWLRNRYLEKSE